MLITRINKYFIYIFIALLVLTAPTAAKADTIVGGVELDWPLKNQEEREKAINYYKELLFNREMVYEIPKEQFKPFKKDPHFLENREALKKGELVLPERELGAFYVMKKMLVIYGVKYNNDKYHIYYYDALGRLAYYDVLDKPFDEFPHIAKQYDSSGRLVGVSYYISDYDQYIFDDKQNFKGRWYGEKLYDKRAKSTMTRKLP